MNISLPGTVKEFGYSEFIRNLIRNDRKRKTKEKLETLLPTGIEGSGATEMHGRIGNRSGRKLKRAIRAGLKRVS